jgi:hypothetical protein
LVDDDEETSARRLLVEKIVDPPELRELLGRIGPDRRAARWRQERLELHGEAAHCKLYQWLVLERGQSSA